MIIENPEIFRSWLAVVLEPLCDADPVALAKYVYALVKKDKPVNEIRESMVDQLYVFLRHKTKSFVALLFKTIENKEYLNHTKDGKDDKQMEIGVGEENRTKESAVVSEEKHSKTDEEAGDDEQENKNKSNEFLETAHVQSDGGKVSETFSGEENKKEDKQKKDNDKEERFKLNRSRIRGDPPNFKSYRSRSRSWDRTDRSKRSRSRDREGGRVDRERERERIRYYRNKSPPRRFDRRRSYSRSTSPPRIRSFFSRSESRSPKFTNRGRYRNRSPPSRNRSPRSRSGSPTLSYEERRKSPFLSGSVRGDLEAILHGQRKNENMSVGLGTRCRDFDEKGFCMRGDLCPFDHGTDPVVLENLPLTEVLSYKNQVPMSVPPMLPQPGIHDVNRPMGNMIRMNPPGIRPRPPPPGHVLMRGQPPLHMLLRGPPSHMLLRGPSKYNPGTPGINPPLNAAKQPYYVRGRVPHNPQQRELINITVDEPGCSGSKRVKDRYDASRQNSYENACIQLRKVPPALNDISHLNNYFSKFGKIINIQVNYDNNPESALITFSSPAEASAAYHNPQAVFNNRFILVYWHNPKRSNENNKPNWSLNNRSMNFTNTELQDGENQGVDGPASESNPGASKTEKQTTIEEKKAQEVAAILKGQEILERSHILKKKTEEKRKEAIKLSSNLLKRSRTLLEKQLKQQKELVSMLENGTLDEAQKKVVKETIKVLQKSIEKIKQDLLSSVKPVKPKPVRKTKEEVQRELLDTELDLITKQQEGEDTSALQKRLAVLKIEMTKFSDKPRILRSNLPPRSLLSTRNKLTLNRSLKKLNKINNSKSTVDHRPTKLLISGYENDEKDLVLSHFRQYGEISDYISDDSTPSIVLNFKTRKEAEDAMLRGKTFQDRLLSVTWFNNNDVLLRRRNSSVSGGSYHMHTGRPVVLNASEPDIDDILNDNDGSSEIEGSFELSEELLLQDDDDDLEDEDRSWRR